MSCRRKANEEELWKFKRFVSVLRQEIEVVVLRWDMKQVRRDKYDGCLCTEKEQFMFCVTNKYFAQHHKLPNKML